VMPYPGSFLAGAHRPQVSFWCLREGDGDAYSIIVSWRYALLRTAILTRDCGSRLALLHFCAYTILARLIREVEPSRPDEAPDGAHTRHETSETEVSAECTQYGFEK